MAWNDSGNGKNPWESGGGQDGPPDLDKLLRDWQRKFSGMFGSGKGGKGSGGGESRVPMIGLLIVAVIGWGITGIYLVDEADRGVVQRFGAYVETTQPGLHWHFPSPIETVDVVNISAVNNFKQTTSMLTSDENIVIVDVVVQYRNTDPLRFLFDVEDPIGTLADASESAIREVIGKNKMDYILGEGRTEIAVATEDVIQNALDEYSTGIIVSKVNLQDVNFPPQVEGAVQDAIKAREDKERLGFEAESYANDILPRARGAAVRQIQDAEAFKERVIADAEGQTARFLALLAEYKKAPEVTRERLFIDALEYVYARSSKVLLDSEDSNSLMYLPIDQLVKNRAAGQSATQSPTGPRSPEASGSVRSQQNPNDLRSRGAR